MDITKTRTITVWDGNYKVRIGSQSMRDLLLDVDGNPRDHQCELEDNMIAAYVDDGKFNTMSDSELESYCNIEFFDATVDYKKEFTLGIINPMTNKPYTICRMDYESRFNAMKAGAFSDEDMQKLADNITTELKKYNFPPINCSDICEEIDDAFWGEMEDCAVRMGMKYYEGEEEEEEGENLTLENLTKEDTKNLVYRELFHCMDFSQAMEVAENIAEEVMEDLKECADNEFTDSDTRLAIGRVLVRLTSIGK